jgi:uncharacterized membrane protein
MNHSGSRINSSNLFITALILLIAGLFTFWLLKTPSGFWAKIDAIAYAVCHRIPSHSYFFAGEQMPLCSRCTGMYLGALGGLVYLLFKPRQAGLPAKKILFALLGFLLLFAVDGINSTLGFFPGVTVLYDPQNWLRLITGSGMGIAIAAMLVPVLHSTAWLDSLPSATLSTWRSFLPLVGIAGVLDILVLSQLSIFLLPLAILSSLTVILILTLVYTVLWLLIWKREGKFHSIRQLIPWLLTGFATALLQTILMDALRFAITGTWAGFTL